MGEYEYLRRHCINMLKSPNPGTQKIAKDVLDLIRHYEHSFTFPQDITNGDMMKIIFNPDIKQEGGESQIVKLYITYEEDLDCLPCEFDLDWWNEPYIKSGYNPFFPHV